MKKLTIVHTDGENFVLNWKGDYRLSEHGGILIVRDERNHEDVLSAPLCNIKRWKVAGE